MSACGKCKHGRHFGSVCSCGCTFGSAVGRKRDAPIDDIERAIRAERHSVPVVRKAMRTGTRSVTADAEADIMRLLKEAKK